MIKTQTFKTTHLHISKQHYALGVAKSSNKAIFDTTLMNSRSDKTCNIIKITWLAKSHTVFIHEVISYHAQFFLFVRLRQCQQPTVYTNVSAMQLDAKMQLLYLPQNSSNSTPSYGFQRFTNTSAHNL